MKKTPQLLNKHIYKLFPDELRNQVLYERRRHRIHTDYQVLPAVLIRMSQTTWISVYRGCPAFSEDPWFEHVTNTGNMYLNVGHVFPYFVEG